MNRQFVIHLGRVIHNNPIGVHCKYEGFILTDNRIFQVTKFLDMLGIQFNNLQFTNDSTIRQVFIGFKLGIVGNRSFVHVHDLDDTEERIIHASRIIGISNVNRYIMSFLDLFVVKLLFVNYVNYNSPITLGVLFHFGTEKFFRTSVNCRIFNLGGQILCMTKAVIFVANQIAHDLVTRRRIFIHRHGQDLRRTIGAIAIFNASFMAAFTHAYFALIILTDFNALITFAFRDNMRRFVNILKFNRNRLCDRGKAAVGLHILTTALFPFAVIDLDIKLVFCLGRFIVQQRSILYNKQGILHDKRNIAVRINNRVFQACKFILMLSIRVCGNDKTNRVSSLHAFFRIEGKCSLIGILDILVEIGNTGNCRSFVQVYNLDDTEE